MSAPCSLVGRKNVYVCEECGGHIVTVDRDEGTTPFMIACKMPGCEGYMQSSMYRVWHDKMIRAWWEWYKPSAIEMLSAAERNHVSRGGLLLRRIEP